LRRALADLLGGFERGSQTETSGCASGPGVKDREEEYGKADDENPAINSLLIDKHQIVIMPGKASLRFPETMKDAQHHD